MRRIFLVASVIAAIGAWWAVPAFGTNAVCTPPQQANSNAPNSETRAVLPTTQGTNHARNESPAIEFKQSNPGQSCNPN